MTEVIIAERRQTAVGDSLEHPVSLELSFFHKTSPKPGRLILTLRRNEETLKVYFDGDRCYMLSSS